MVNLIFGIPLLSYYDDFGALSPEIIGQRALSTIIKGAKLLLILFNDRKSEWDNTTKFLGLLGPFPRPENGMALSISLPLDKVDRRADIAERIATKGEITHQELGKLVGKLSFSQTAVFGMFGRTMINRSSANLKTPLT